MKTIEEVDEELKSNGVSCRIINPDYDNQKFIAVFGLGNMSKKEINQIIGNNDLAVIFFPSCNEQKRDITSSTYDRAQKRLAKEVNAFMGI